MSGLQSGFTAALLDPALAVPPGLCNPDGQPAGKRFDVYRNNVVFSLTEALGTAFPVIRKLLGEAFFRAMAGVYLRRHPPASPLMMFYGADMPGFLESFPPVAHLGYLPDVARLELAIRQSYHAADAAAVEARMLGALPPARLLAARVGFAPALRLVRSRWPVHGIWQANTSSRAPKPQDRGENVLITRPGFDPEVGVLAPGGGVFVAALLAGQTFGAALDAATSRVADFDLSAVLGDLIAGGAIIHIDEDTE